MNRPGIQTNNAANSPVGINAPTKKAKDVTFASIPGSAGAYRRQQQTIGHPFQPAVDSVEDSHN